MDGFNKHVTAIIIFYVPYSYSYLHPSLNYIERRVPKHAGRPGYGSENSSDQRVYGLVRVVAWFENKRTFFCELKINNRRPAYAPRARGKY